MLDFKWFHLFISGKGFSLRKVGISSDDKTYIQVRQKSTLNHKNHWLVISSSFTAKQASPFCSAITRFLNGVPLSITHLCNQFCITKMITNSECWNWGERQHQTPTQPIPKFEVNAPTAWTTWSSKPALSLSSSIVNSIDNMTIITLSQILMTRRSWSGSRAAVVPAWKRESA